VTRKPLSAAGTRVRDALKEAGVASDVIEYDTPARTSAEAASVLGCEVGAIAKSLVFRAASGAPVLVIASGANRVDEARVALLAGEPLGKADAGFVRAATGYAIGGIPPLAHASQLTTFIDRDLLAYDVVYAAGGTPHAMFAIAPSDLVRLARGMVADTKVLTMNVNKGG
jgi:prolyl-tRNA editing enzyme YbaK/EbsC (Cys-tRNA(Pro) deacylase)